MDIQSTVDTLRSNPKGVRFTDLVKICGYFFGTPRQRGTGHVVYKKPWKGDPRINLQNAKGMAKAYQVRQVIKALEKLREYDS